MTNKNSAGADGEPPADAAQTDDDTNELRVLAAANLSVSSIQTGSAAGQAPGSRASAWLKQMESEIERLHARWLEVEGRLAGSENRVRELQQRSNDKGAQVERLKAELKEVEAVLASRNEAVASRDLQIGELQASDTERSAAQAALAEELQSAEQRCSELRDQLDTSVAQNHRLEQLIDDEKSQAQNLHTQTQDLSSTNDTLRSQLQDLELYIEGRKSSWTELNAKLAQYKEALAGMELVIRGTDKKNALKEKEKDALSARILDLERKCAQSDGRRQERDAAYQALEERLRDQMQATEGLKVEFAQQSKESDQIRKESVGQIKLVTSLEHGLARRDEAIEKLESDLRIQRETAEHLSAENAKYAYRLSQLEQSLDDKFSTIQSLRAELKEANQQSSGLEVKLLSVSALESEIEVERIATQEQIDRLQKEVGTLGAEREELASSLSIAQDRLGEIETRLGQLEDENAGLQDESSAQQELIAQLEMDLAAREQVISAFDHSAERLDDLSRSLRQVGGDLDWPLVDEALLFGDEARDTDSNAGGDGECVDIGLAEEGALVDGLDFNALDAAARRRLLIDLTGDKHVEYPLFKRSITIGRSSKSDICLRNVVVSRIHARLLADETGTVIEDAGSKNGILVNSRPVDRTTLHHGDIVSLGGKWDLKYVEMDVAGS